MIRHMRSQMPELINKCCYFHLAGEALLGEGGRLIFWLINTFIQAGYHCFVDRSLTNKSLPDLAKRTCFLRRVHLVENPTQVPKPAIYITDSPTRASGGSEWHKEIRIRFDVFSSYFFEKPLVLPFAIHPVHYFHGNHLRLGTYRNSVRNIRILFSGDFKGYHKSLVRYPNTKLPRSKVIEILCRELPLKVFFVQTNEELANVLDQGCPHKCVLLDTSRLWIQDKIWLEILARADFFLAPPGIVMPMCHNIVEAMAVGTIPITNYPEWFDPDLRERFQCLCFDDASSLLSAVEKALEMPADRVASMRRHAVTYYEEHLAPQVFVGRVESHPLRRLTLLMLTEKYVAHNARRLGPRSVLIRGTDKAGRWAWVRRLLRFGRPD